MKRTEKSHTGWYFLLIIFAAYIVAFFVKRTLATESLMFAGTIIKQIIPALGLVFILLVVLNWLLRPEHIIKHLGKDSGIKGWIYSIVGGVLSTGPIYLWYPLLNELQKQGVRDGYIACFLYNRSIKPALIPLFIYYFGLVYVGVLTIVVTMASVLQGYVVEKIMEVKK